MKKIIVILGLMLALPASAVFPQKRAFTIADLYKIHYVGSPSVSPDGNLVAFTVSDYNMPKGLSKTNIYVMNSDGSNLRKITDSNKSNYDPLWTNSSNAVYFISTESGTPQIYYYSFKTNKTKKITDFSMGVDAPVLSPDNKLIAFAAKVYPECGADSKCNKKIDSAAANGPIQAYVADHLLFRHWTEYAAGKYSHIIIFNIKDNTYRDVTPGEYAAPVFMLGGGIGFNFSPDSKELCFVSKHVNHPEASTNADLFTVPVNGGKTVDITKGNKAWDGWPIYSPDGKYIAYRTQKIPGYESDLFRLAVYNRKTGVSKIISGNFDNWIDDFRWSPDSKIIYFIGEVGGCTPIYKISLREDKIIPVIGGKVINGFSLDDKGNIYFSSSKTSKPTEIYKINLNNNSESELTSFNKKIEEAVDIRPADTMWVKGAGGKEVEVFIVKPHNFEKGKKYPIILNVHGGPQMQWMNSFRGDWQVYPGAGYVVAYPNPHGSTGRGEAYTAEISGDWGGKVFTDLMKVTDALTKLPYIDSTRMGAMGWSYGGYMMDWFQAKTKRFKCLASMMGVYDLRSMWGGTEELWFVNHELDGQPWNSKEYEKFSPSYFAKNFSTPTLIITGQKDFRVPYTQSIQYFTTLQTLGVPSRLIIFKNDGHWPDYVKSMPLYYDAHLDWFHKYLGGAPAPYNVHKMAENLSF